MTWLTKRIERRLLQEMMWPSNEVFQKVVRGRNIDNLDTGSLIRALVSSFAAERGITVTKSRT
jgi:hypothetical protein